MNKISIETIDGKIWQPDRVIVDLIKASQKGSVEIDLRYEGPCAKSCGLEQLLDTLVEKFAFDPNCYTILTSNQKSSTHYRETKTSFEELDFVKNKAKQITQFASSLDKRFGFFIGRSNWIRLGIGSYLHSKYKTDTLMTFHFDSKSDYHLANFGLEEFFGRYPNDNHVFDFIKCLPIKNNEYSYPIKYNSTALDMQNYYSQIFCDVVCETNFSGNTFCMTEKILRPIMFKRPFLIQGSVDFLKNIKRLGFKTFNQWWDEGYDEDPADFKYEALKYNIDYIGQQSVETIKQWNDQMHDICEHNYQCLLNLTHQQIAETNFNE